MNIPDFGGHWNIVPAANFLWQLIEQGKLIITPDPDRRIVYHDACHYGRYHGIYDEPRKLISLVLGKPPLEMSMNRETAMCCGGGGGLVWGEEDLQTNASMSSGSNKQASNSPI